MHTKYELKVQAIRSKGQQPRLYVYFPLPLAAAIGLEAGDAVQWELLDRNELHLVRVNTPMPQAKQKSKMSSKISDAAAVKL
jgi:hypothetical protein